MIGVTLKREKLCTYFGRRNEKATLGRRTEDGAARSLIISWTLYYSAHLAITTRCTLQTRPIICIRPLVLKCLDGVEKLDNKRYTPQVLSVFLNILSTYNNFTLLEKRVLQHCLALGKDATVERQPLQSNPRTLNQNAGPTGLVFTYLFPSLTVHPSQNMGNWHFKSNFEINKKN